MWDQASAEFASGASGTAQVFHKAEGVSLNSVWRNVEYPNLQRSGVGMNFRTVGEDRWWGTTANTSVPNRVRTPTGSERELLGRAGLILYRDGEGLEVDSEMLDPPMAIAVCARPVHSLATAPARSIPDEIVGALTWMGFTVEFLGTLS